MSSPLTDSASIDNRRWNLIISTVSAIIVLAVIFLMEGPRPEGMRGSIDVTWMPHLNGLANTGTTLSLLAALFFIRRRNILAHRNAMLTAFGFTTVFLVSYIIYHAFQMAQGTYDGPLRGLYLVILISHITLAPVVVPVALFALHRGLTDQRAQHRRIVRIGYPLWLYVSVSGVLVYVAQYLL
ncbi:MAG: putative membrane protein [Myxococcota bacterium]|jgi:putative membrane protein